MRTVRPATSPGAPTIANQLKASMAIPQTPQDPIPPSLSKLRRQLHGAGKAPAPHSAVADETVDFDSLASDDAVREELAQAGRPKPVPDEIEALLHRYQAEKARRTPPEVH